MTGQRRLSQAISEGDGISLIVPVVDAEGAREATAAGAEGLLVRENIAGIRDATDLPLLWIGSGGDADACVLSLSEVNEDDVEARYKSMLERGIECVVEVTDSDQLEIALELLDPEIFMLSPAAEDLGEDAAVERVLDLLPDVPAGKLAIAHLFVQTRERVAELERTGFDAVTVGTPDLAGLASAAPPEV